MARLSSAKAPTPVRIWSGPLKRNRNDSFFHLILPQQDFLYKNYFSLKLPGEANSRIHSLNAGNGEVLVKWVVSLSKLEFSISTKGSSGL